MDATCVGPRSGLAMRGARGSLVLGLAALLGSACAKPPEPMALLQTRARYEAASADAERVALAPVEFLQARRAVERAEEAWESDKDENEVRHLARVADHRTRIALAGARANAVEAQQELLAFELSRTREDAVDAVHGRAASARSRAEARSSKARSGSAMSGRDERDDSEPSAEELVEAMLAIERMQARADERARERYGAGPTRGASDGGGAWTSRERDRGDWGGRARLDRARSDSSRSSDALREELRAARRGEREASRTQDELRSAAGDASEVAEELAALEQRLERTHGELEERQAVLLDRMQEAVDALDQAAESQQDRRVAAQDVLEEARALRAEAASDGSSDASALRGDTRRDAQGDTQRAAPSTPGASVAARESSASRRSQDREEADASSARSSRGERPVQVQIAGLTLEEQRAIEGAERETNEVLRRQESEARRTLEAIERARRGTSDAQATSTRDLAATLRDRQGRLEQLVAENERLRASNERLLAAISDTRSAGRAGEPPAVSAPPPSRATSEGSGSEALRSDARDASASEETGSAKGRQGEGTQSSGDAGGRADEPQTEQQRAAVERMERFERQRARLEAWNAQLVPGGVVVVLTDLFDSGDAEPSSQGRAEVARLATLLADMGDRRIRIEGHTDSTGSAELNRRLSEQRARAVRDQLERAGIAVDRIESSGAGEADPIAPNRTAAGREKNRRIEVTVYDEMTGES